MRKRNDMVFMIIMMLFIYLICYGFVKYGIQ